MFIFYFSLQGSAVQFSAVRPWCYLHRTIFLDVLLIDAAIRTNREVKWSLIFSIFILPFFFDMYNNKQVFHNIAVKKYFKKK